MKVSELPTVIIIYRGLPTPDVLAATEALLEVGLSAFEVTLDSPEPLKAIGAMIQHFGNDVAVGAGTVRRVRDVESAAHAGASFLLSPHLDQEIVAATKAAGLISIPGAYTPTEVCHAWEAGADMVKVFPLQPAGPQYIRYLLEPLRDIRLLASGGVSADIGRACLDAGCATLGVGAGLLDRQAVMLQDWKALQVAGTRFLARLTGEVVSTTVAL